MLQRLAAKSPVASARLAGLALAAAIAALPMTPTAAQEPETQSVARPMIAPQGVRVELLAGFDDSSFDHGTLYGGRIGYDRRIGRNFSLGVDAEFTDMTTKQDIAPFSPIVVRDGPDLYLGARGTFALSRRFSLHGGAGYTIARLGHFELAPGNIIVGAEERHEGFRLIAGGQFQVGRNVFIGAEYRYSEYDGVQKRDQYVGTIGFRF
jgi:outer membrane immunogenic protein